MLGTGPRRRDGSEDAREGFGWCQPRAHGQRGGERGADRTVFRRAVRLDSFLLEHLVSVRQRLGDLDTALLLTVIGLSALQGARAGQVPDAPVNAHSLALVTGIPRETVRRKLAALGRRGWIEPSPDGGWRLVIEFGGEVAAYRNLDDLTQDTNRRLGLVEQLVLIGTREQ